MIGFSLHMAAGLQVLAFLFRDQIKLRLLLLSGSLLYAFYYVTYPAQPLYQAAGWALTMATANCLILFGLINERMPRAMDPVDRMIFDYFGTPLPGHFRRIMFHAKRGATDAAVQVTWMGARPDKVYFLHKGQARIDLADRCFTLEAPRFLGEMSIVLDQPASADAWLMPGAEYLEWDRGQLDRLFARTPVLRAVFDQLLSRDMAKKLAERPDHMPLPAQPDAADKPMPLPTP